MRLKSTGKAGKFRNLVGNVAEFVFDDPAALAKVEPTPAEVDKLLRASIDKLRVIGGSALSSPDLKVETPYPVDPAELHGFSDVGFRLAFTAPAEPLQARLRRTLTAQGYLLPPAK